MRQRFLGSARWLVVTLGVVLLTSLTVDATLTGGGISQSALGILARSVAKEAPRCPEGSIEMVLGDRPLCVDVYEASPDPSCTRTLVGSAGDTRKNLDDQNCNAVSLKGSTPWTFVTLGQAQELCARSGKRLLSSESWYRASLGVPDEKGGKACNVQGSGVTPSGSYEACVSGGGVHDMVGNAWEWVDGQVVDGRFEDREVPDGGYIAEADGSGFVTKTSDVPSPDYHLDYFWSAREGTYGILRGGFYGSGDDAGLYAIQAKTAPSFSGAAIGFRCISDPQQ